MNTKEFAKLCHVEKRTLFYYDEIGLLKPIYRNENGYREYDVSQAEVMDTIKLLQSASFTLEEIKSILTNSETNRITDLENGVKKTNEKIKQLTAISNYFESKINLYKEFKKENVIQSKKEEFNIKIIQEVKQIPGQKFNYTNFKFYDGFYWDNNSLYLYSFDDSGEIHFNETTYSFFAKIKSKAFPLVLFVEQCKEKFNIPSNYITLIQQVPHILFYEEGKVLIKVTYIPNK